MLAGKECCFRVNDAPAAAFAGIWRKSEEGIVFAFPTCERKAEVHLKVGVRFKHMNRSIKSGMISIACVER